MQLPRRFGERVTLPPYRASWVQAGQPVFLDVGERCVDEDWPWWWPSTGMKA